MWRKCYPSMYEGSMVGLGAAVFAVWGYVITKQEPSREFGSSVRLNPKLLSIIIGEPEKEIVDAIVVLCSPDQNSTTKDKEGRRLIRISEFDYQVVNGQKYMDVRKTEERRQQLREAQARYRTKQDMSACPPVSTPVNTSPQTVAVSTGFRKPSMEEVGLYSSKLGIDPEEAVKFFDYYESNGWRVGRNPMRSWQAAMRNWKKNIRTYENNAGTNSSGAQRRTDRNEGQIGAGGGKYANVAIVAKVPDIQRPSTGTDAA